MTMLETQPDVLLVEDSDDDVWVARRAFHRHLMGGRLARVRTGEEALTYLRESLIPHSGAPSCPRVVFLDLNLPGIRGLEVLRQMRADERLRLIPVVVISSSSRDSDVHESYRLGANSFVKKRYGQSQPGEYVVDIARYWLDLNQPVR
jgi:CheY-like chemotaxis protein